MARKIRWIAENVIDVVRKEHGKSISVDDVLREEKRHEELGILAASRQAKDLLLEEYCLERGNDGQLCLTADFQPSMPDGGEADSSEDSSVFGELEKEFLEWRRKHLRYAAKAAAESSQSRPNAARRRPLGSPEGILP